MATPLDLLAPPFSHPSEQSLASKAPPESTLDLLSPRFPHPSEQEQPLVSKAPLDLLAPPFPHPSEQPTASKARRGPPPPPSPPDLQSTPSYDASSGLGAAVLSLAKMAARQALGSTDRTPGIPTAAPSAPAASRRSNVRDIVVLVDWWLERVEGEEGKIRIAGITETPLMRKGGSSSIGNRRAASRVFRSAIAKRHDFSTLETVDGLLVLIVSLLNSSQTQENGFSQEVCECFEPGFPADWEKLVNTNMEQVDEHSKSPSKCTADALNGSVVLAFLEKYLRDSFIYSRGYDFVENNVNSSRISPSNTEGPCNERLSSFSNNMAASEGSGDGRMDMPEGPLTPPVETCSGEAYDQHERTQIGASEQATADHPISSVLEVDDNRSALSKNASVEKEGYMGRVGCDQAEQDDEIHHENVRCFSSELEMVSHPIVADLINNHMSRTSCELGERGSPKCGETSVNPGTGDALEVPTEGMTTQFGTVRVSQDNTVRRLRSGKVLGVPESAAVKRVNKRKRMQHEASSSKMIPKEGVTPTADLTSHDNDCSVAKDKLQLHDTARKGRGRPAKRGSGNSKREHKILFYTWG